MPPLDQATFAEFVRQRALDPNLRADVETVWRYAAYHFTGQTRSGGTL